jgi:hypothetical protein
MLLWASVWKRYCGQCGGRLAGALLVAEDGKVHLGGEESYYGAGNCLFRSSNAPATQ